MAVVKTITVYNWNKKMLRVFQVRVFALFFLGCRKFVKHFELKNKFFYKTVIPLTDHLQSFIKYLFQIVFSFQLFWRKHFRTMSKLRHSKTKVVSCFRYSIDTACWCLTSFVTQARVKVCCKFMTIGTFFQRIYGPFISQASIEANKLNLSEQLLLLLLQTKITVNQNNVIVYKHLKF